MQVRLEEFTDIVGRNSRQPKEGLGFDGLRIFQLGAEVVRRISSTTDAYAVRSTPASDP